MGELFVAVLSKYSWTFVLLYILGWMLLRWVHYFLNVHRVKKARSPRKVRPIIARLNFRFRQCKRNVTGYNYKKTSDKLDIYLFCGFVLSVVLVPVGLFLDGSLSWSINPDPMEWGVIGDFFGGMLNPILAFASFIALLYTIRIQSEELRLTREEFEKSVEAQSGSARALEQQLEQNKSQYLRAQYNELFIPISNRLNYYLHDKNTLHVDDKFRSYNELLLAVFESYTFFNMVSSPKDGYKGKSTRISRQVERNIHQLLARLAVLLKEYGDQFGSTVIYRDYLYQFTEVVALMHLFELLNARQGDYQIFNIDEYYEARGFCPIDTSKN